MASPGPCSAAVLLGCRVATAAGVVVLLVPVARSTPDAVAAPPLPATVQPVVAPDRPPDPEPAPAVTPSRRPAVESVAPSRPTRFRFTGHGISVTAKVCAMPNAIVLDPPGDPRRQVCWVRPGMGEAPGSRTATTYVLGHSYANDPQTVLGGVSRLASAQLAHADTVWRSGVPTRTITALDGAHLTLWTRHGVLDYRVRDAFAVPKPSFGLVRRVEDDTIRRRVVLVTCAVRGGRDLDYNVIVEAFLVSARPA